MITRMHPRDFCALDLKGRAALVLRANAVARAIVEGFEARGQWWDLRLTKNEDLDLHTGFWTRRPEAEEHRWMIGRTRPGWIEGPSGALFIGFTGGGREFLIAPDVVEDPWPRIDWPDLLDFTTFEAGPIER